MNALTRSSSVNRQVVQENGRILRRPARQKTRGTPARPTGAPYRCFPFLLLCDPYWGRRDGLPSTYPVQFTLGYQLRPRLALQLSGVSAATKGSTTDFVTQARGMELPYSRTYANRSSSLSALARYTLVGEPAQRLHVDGLGGFTLHRATFDGTGSYPDSNAPGGYGGYDLHSRENDLLLTGGVSVRYRLCTHFEAVADGTVSASLRAMRDVTPAVAVELRYNFGHP